MSGEATFRAIADPSRRRMLDHLASGERSVTELCDLFEMSQPAISQHLKILRDAGLVRNRREGRTRLYSLDARPLLEVYDWVSHYQRFWVVKLDALATLLAREAAKKPVKR